jgi:HrpA-like RNA helicase
MSDPDAGFSKIFGTVRRVEPERSRLSGWDRICRNRSAAKAIPSGISRRTIGRLAPRTEGDVLIFMPGKYEISRTISAIRLRVSDRFVVLPLHGELRPSNRTPHSPITKSAGQLATNVAETSLTIDGVR